VVQVAAAVEANGLVQAHLAGNVLSLSGCCQLVGRFVEVGDVSLQLNED